MNQRKKTSAVIFDCDGVMFDSRQANINFYNHLLVRFQQPPLTENQVEFVHMHTVEESVQFLFENTPHVEEAQAYRKSIDYTPFIRDMVPEPELKPLLDALKTRFGLAVATNRSTTIGEVLKHHTLSHYFDIVVSSLDVDRPKPHPESLEKILVFFRIHPNQAAYVGDSLVDSQTARSAGIPFIAYKNPALDADHHVGSLLEILDVVDSGR